MKIRLLQLGQLSTCCYLVWDETTKNCVVIDPAARASRIREAMEADGLHLCHIFLTHLHFDHIGAVDALRAPDVTVWCCKEELAHQELVMGAMDTTLPLSFYDEGDVLTCDSMTFRVLRTPGHTIGSVCLMADDVLFTGDTLFAGSYGRTDFEGGDAAAMRASLKRLAQLPGDYTVLSGHSAPTTLSHERETNVYLQEAMAE